MELKKTKPKYQNQVHIVTKGEQNDGDYIIETSILTIEEFKILEPHLYELLPPATGNRCNFDAEDKRLEEIGAPENIVDLYDCLIELPCGKYGCTDLCYEDIIYFDENGVGYDIE